MSKKTMAEYSRVVGRVVTTLCLCSLASWSMAAEVPLWELGIGPGVMSLPAYRGSSEDRTYVLPMPYFTYHGRYLRADRDGVSGSIFHTEHVSLVASLAASPPVSGRGVEVRRGMGGLDPTFELGPQLNITLFKSADASQRIKLELPLRAAYTLEAAPRSAGYVFHPKIAIDLAAIPSMKKWSGGLSGGPIFSDSRQNNYFYSVSAAEAMIGRPAYTAKSGFAGVQLTSFLSRRFPKYWVGGFARYDNVSGAVFAASPLVERKSNLAVGLAVSRIFKVSKRTVTETED
jgi:MipA family protein